MFAVTVTTNFGTPCQPPIANPQGSSMRLRDLTARLDHEVPLAGGTQSQQTPCRHSIGGHPVGPNVAEGEIGATVGGVGPGT
jgi:hypothetical protein